MHKIKTIAVDGFRGQRKLIKINLHESANFIIGRNGTGKTTFINLINAALAADIDALRATKFNSIELTFRPSGNRQTPKVLITKDVSDGLDDMVYHVQDSASADADDYDVMRTVRRRVVSENPRRIAISAPAPVRPLKDRLRTIYKTTWLSLQRRNDVTEFDDFDDDESSDVDRKLDQVLSELVKYFSRLDRSVAEETQNFQRRWFLSFLASERPVNSLTINQLDLREERRALSSIFEKFNLSKETYEDQLDKHFKLVDKVRRSLTNKEAPGRLADIFIMFDTVRLHALVEQWQELEEVQRRTYMPKSDFIKAASDMLFRKSVNVNRSNQAIITSDDGQNVPIRSLSSGEKQLLIFLSETLLQEQQSYIFLADEPELSLHVEWQEELVPNLLKINPSAQVLFATHSPDVVNKYQNNVFKMEELIE